MTQPPQPASRRTRLLAFLADAAIACACGLPGFGLLVWPLVLGLGAGGHYPGALPDYSVLGVILFLGLGGSYMGAQFSLLAKRGQTFGKRLLGIRIVNDANGGNPGVVPAVVLRLIVPGGASLIPYIGWLFAMVNLAFIFGPDRRCLHDRIAGTRVVVAERD